MLSHPPIFPIGFSNNFQVLQFLKHDGFVETARAFGEEVHEEKKALSLDPNAVIEGFDLKEDEDAGHRQRKILIELLDIIPIC
jgi:hypothetical protein